MLEIFDKNLKKLAILENATNIIINEKLNGIDLIEFALPYNDKKNQFCKPFNYVRYNEGNYHRIIPATLDKTETGLIQYQAENAIATLLNDCLHGYHIVGNLGYYTDKVINYVLDHQRVKLWHPGICEFNRQFEYGWENETLLSALFSIGNPIADKFKWEFDSISKPWKINLKKLNIEDKPKEYIRNSKNLMHLIKNSDPKNICTRLYPYGYGEGVNQLNISEINDGRKYIESPQEIIDKYGIIERIWIDRRYENVESLKAAAQTMLEKLQEPITTYEVEYAAIGKGFFNLKCGDIVEIIDTETNVKYKNFVIEIEKDVTEIENSKIVIANQPSDIAGTVAEMADRQRIEMSYAQGATQVYAQSIQANCDSKNGAEMNFYIPAEMRIINKVNLKIKVESFRAYSKSTRLNGSGSRTSAWEPSRTKTSTWDGNEKIGTTTDYRSKPHITTHDEKIVDGGNRDFTVYSNTPGWSGHVTLYWVREHEHYYELPNHNHGFSYTLSGHDHDVEIPGHDHDVDISHEHDIVPGIYKFGNAGRFELYINNKYIKTIYDTSAEINITDYLTDKRTGKINRGNWQKIEIRPNDLAYISIDMNLQGFVQSRGDRTV